MNTLECAHNLRELLDLENGEVTLEVATLDAALDDKLSAIVVVMRELDAKANANSALALEYTARAESAKKEWARLRAYLELCMRAAGVQKRKLDVGTCWLQTTTSVQLHGGDAVWAGAQTNLRFVRERVTFAPDKTAIREALEAGESVPGAQLQTTEGVRVR